MEYQHQITDAGPGPMLLQNTVDNSPEIYPLIPDALKLILQVYKTADLNELLSNLSAAAAKRNFLVFKKNKYINILTENIMLFYFRHASSILVTADAQEYFINHSLDQLHQLLSGKQFFRINRQCLVNFNAVVDAEHYPARKLLVRISTPTKVKLIVSKERVGSFLQWLDNR